MKFSHLNNVRCPKTKKPLQVEIEQLVDGKIKEGTLIEPQSGNKYAIVNFDDGFKNVINNAYPIMKKYDAKGCLYVVSSLFPFNV